MKKIKLYGKFNRQKVNNIKDIDFQSACKADFD